MELKDVLDVLIVAYIMYLLFKLLKGTMAFNIFIGVLAFYAVWWAVQYFEMRLLETVLSKFVAYGVLILIIIFQQEVRSFLLMLGKSTLKGRMTFLQSIFGDDWQGPGSENKESALVDSLVKTIGELAKVKDGALIVFSDQANLDYFANSGVRLDAMISPSLIRNIFKKNAPLHDGAMVIVGDRIHSASVILPVTQSTLSTDLGLRHRAGLGITETTNVASLMVSEETGAISYAVEGKLHRNVNKTQLKEFLSKNIS